jgi:glycosyltransferase involved in cell wall biosynthesis
MAPTRVAYCIDSMSAFGGSELNAVRTVESLDRSRVQPLILTLNAEGGMASRYASIGVQIHAFAISSLVSLDAARRLSDVIDLLRRERVDVVHCHDMYSNFFFTVAARMARVPLVIASKRWTERQHAKHLLTDVIGYRLAHRVLANSREVADSARRQELVPERKIVVVPNFVEADAFRLLEPPERLAWRARLGIADNAQLIGIVAMLRPEKDHWTLLQAFDRAALDNPRMHLAIVGAGPEETKLRELVAALRTAERVHFLGLVPNRPCPQQLFDVAVLSSLHEGFPNSLLEAMACGVPVVATSVGGVSDVVVDRETGLLVPVRDVQAMSSAIAQLITDPARALKLGTAGQERARRYFSAEAVVHQLVTLYEADLPSPRRPLHSSS